MSVHEAAERHCAWRLQLASLLTAVHVAIDMLRRCAAGPVVGAAWTYRLMLGGVARRSSGCSASGDAISTRRRRAGLPRRASYPVYILHQTVIVVIGFYLVRLAAVARGRWPVLIGSVSGDDVRAVRGRPAYAGAAIPVRMRPLEVRASDSSSAAAHTPKATA